MVRVENDSKPQIEPIVVVIHVDCQSHSFLVQFSISLRSRVSQKSKIQLATVVQFGYWKQSGVNQSHNKLKSERLPSSRKLEHCPSYVQSQLCSVITE